MPKYSYFCLGIACGLATYSLIQDFLGREEYITWIQDRWISRWISVPVASAAILISTIAIHYDLRSDMQGRRQS